MAAKPTRIKKSSQLTARQIQTGILAELEHLCNALHTRDDLPGIADTLIALTKGVEEIVKTNAALGEQVQILHWAMRELRGSIEQLTAVARTEYVARDAMLPQQRSPQ